MSGTFTHNQLVVAVFAMSIAAGLSSLIRSDWAIILCTALGFCGLVILILYGLYPGSALTGIHTIQFYIAGLHSPRDIWVDIDAFKGFWLALGAFIVGSVLNLYLAWTFKPKPATENELLG